MPLDDQKRNMQLVRHLNEFQAPPTSVAIGNFDGLHRGHRAVLDRMMQAAADGGLAPAVLTFEPHPRRFFARLAPVFRIEPLGMKLRRLRLAGVRYVFMPRFNAAFAALSAEAFLEEVLGRQLNAKAVVTGENFAFGKGRGGTVETLRAWGATHGVAIHTVAPVMAEDDICSSSAVRQALARGDVAHAGALLGHAYQLGGRVKHGDGRGRQLGFPTANIALVPGLKLPAHGVYAVRATVQDPLGERHYDGVVNLGVRPTIGGQDHASLELHLFDFAGDIYGARVTVQFVRQLRHEMKFESLAALTRQIAEDCALAKQLLQGHA